MYALIVMVLASWADGGSASSSTPGFESYELCSTAKQRVEQHFGAVMPKPHGGQQHNIVVAECVRVKP